ncbi:hypothetical protein L8W60_03575 [Campylobacter lari]|nr:hypothetical protein [Campylobacter lari]
MLIWKKITTFRLKGFLKKRFRKIIFFLSEKFDINIVEIKQKDKNLVKNQYSKKNLFNLWEEIFSFEKAYCVDALQYNDIYLYPFIRQWIWLRLNYLFFKNIDNPKLKLFYGIDEIPLNIRKKIKEQYFIKEIKDIQSENTDFLFFSSYTSVENVRIDNGKIYQRIIDPIYEEVSKYGKTQKIAILQNYLHIYEYSKETFFYPISVFMMPSHKKIRYIDSDNFSLDFIKKINHHVQSLDIKIEDILNMLDNALYGVECYMELLQKISPKVIFLHSYFYFMPLVIAAHKLNIAVIDIQHGEISSKNPAYGGLENFLHKNKIYNFLPTKFFVWSEKYSEHIHRTFPIANKAIIVGNLWLNRQKSFYTHLIDGYIESIKSNKKVILFLLNNTYQVDPFFLSLAEELDDRFVVLVRHHPKPLKLFNVGHFCNKKNIFIDNKIDDCIIGELFENCDYCISAGSTASKDALSFNIVNFVFGEESRVNFQEEIENKEMYFLNHASEFFEYIEQLDYHAKKISSNVIRANNIKQCLDELINMEERC